VGVPIPIGAGWRGLRDALPRGRTLPDESWERRHSWMVTLLWGNAAGLLVYSLYMGYSIPHSLADSVPVAVFAVVARAGFSRKVRAAVAATGLLTASALLVHASGGYIEAHFHFFVTIVVLTLYEDWTPFLLAAGYVVVHHGLGGALVPGDVYNHSDAETHPWKWALIHAAFVAAAGVASIVSWRLNETVREGQQHALAEAQASEERFRSAFHDAVVGMCLTAPDGRLVRVNTALCDVLGYSEAELIGRPFHEFTHPEDLEASRAGLRETLSGRQVGFQVEKRYVDAHGEIVWVHLSTRLVRDPDGAPLHFVSQIQDITEQRRTSEALAHQAVHDPLTGLPNRTLLYDRIEHALDRTTRLETDVAVLFIDVDRFKVINDSLGHEAGDKLLVEVAVRLSRAVRPGDTVGRFGGDEFVVVIEGVESEHDVLALAERLSRELARPVTLEEEDDHVVTASVGVAIGGSGHTAEVLLRDADAAMYRAKSAGGGRSELFDADMRHAAVERLRTERALRRALADGELRLHYQPIVALDGGAVRAVEALVRWQRPGHGLLGPGAFIELAEETGLIQQVGEWVLREACRQAAAWRRELGERAPLPVHVNLSARQIGRVELPSVVAHAMREAGLEPRDLALEITESGLIEASDRPAAILGALKALGVAIVLDDFGTGYSSLGYLKRFPIDEIKIDRSFVAKLGDAREDTAIVKAILGMADGLDLSVVAEGVETEEQVEALRALGCHLAQGFWYAKPMEAAGIELVAQNGRRARGATAARA